MTQATIQNDWVLGFEGIAYQGVSRRAFLLSGAGVAFGVTFGGTLAGLSEVLPSRASLRPTLGARRGRRHGGPSTRPPPRWGRG